jgi:hypothetical protein
MGRWKNIEPTQVRRSLREHPWYFAYYCEAPEDRDDSQWYHALIFRDDDRQQFGAFELLSAEVDDVKFQARHDLRQLASKIVSNDAYRATLLSDSPQLPVLWRRH